MSSLSSVVSQAASISVEALTTAALFANLEMFILNFALLLFECFERNA
jgi:hypothetical protein